MTPLLHLGLLLEIEPLLCLGPNGITDGTFQLLHLHLLYTWVTSITMVSRLTRVTCQNHIIQAFRSLLLHNHYDQTHAVYQSMITTSNGSFPYLAFINFSFPHVLKQSVKQFFTC